MFLPRSTALPILLALLAASVQAASLVKRDGPMPDMPMGDKSTVTADQLKKINADTATCPAEGEFKAECRTAEQAAPLISKAFAMDKIEAPMTKAALVSLILLETGNLKYDKNQ